MEEKKSNLKVKEHKTPTPVENVKTEVKEQKVSVPVKEEVKEKKKEESSSKKINKTEATSAPTSLPISKKHSMYICSFIKNKSIDRAMKELNEVLLYKRAIPFKGEIPHRKGKGMMSGRYPINATKIFIQILKGLKGNVLANGMDLERTKIVSCSASWAARPRRAGGVRFKRTNVTLKAQEIAQ